MNLADLEHVIDFPRRSNVVYVLFYFRGEADGEKPFYVGETASLIGRMTDYLRGTFAAATDFKVGEAVRYLVQHDIRVKVGYQEHPDRRSARAKESEFIARLRGEGVPLLNDLAGFDYRSANESAERSKVHQFCDAYILRTGGPS